MTPFYERDGIVIYCGDCNITIAQLDGPFDAVITDPPFGTQTAEWDNKPDRNVWVELRRLCIAGPLAVFGYAEQLFEQAQFFDGLHLIGFVVWHKYNEIMVSPGLTRAHQDIAIWGNSRAQVQSENAREPYSECGNTARWHNSLGGTYTTEQNGFCKNMGEEIKKRGNSTGRHKSGRRCTDLWRIPAPGAGFNSHLRNHPNEKPLEVMGRLCRLLTKPKDIILDCYMGSGTTLVAAQQEGRRATGIEISEDYCAIAVERLRQPTFWSVPVETAPVKVEQATLL